MIEQSNTRVEPAGYLDQYGNFERIAQDWMEEEPGTVWQPVFYEFQQTAAPVAKPLTEAEAKLLLKKSDLLDMFLHIGWYSAPRKGFDEHGMALIRAIERAHDIDQGGAA